MTYALFVEDSYRAMRESAPTVGNMLALSWWLRSIGELLLHMPPELQREWADQFAALIVIKYGHIEPGIAALCVRQGLADAQAQWPTRVAVVR